MEAVDRVRLRARRRRENWMDLGVMSGNADELTIIVVEWGINL